MIKPSWIIFGIFIIVFTLKLIKWREINTERRRPRPTHCHVGFIEASTESNDEYPKHRAVGTSRARRQQQSINSNYDNHSEIHSLDSFRTSGSRRSNQKYTSSDLDCSVGLGSLFQDLFSFENYLSPKSEEFSSSLFSIDDDDIRNDGYSNNSVDFCMHNSQAYHSSIYANHDSTQHNDLDIHHDLHHHHDLIPHQDSLHGEQTNWSNDFHTSFDSYESSVDSDWGYD